MWLICITTFVIMATFSVSVSTHFRSDWRIMQLHIKKQYHVSRHSYAVAAIQSGDDIKTVQENLGHATAAFTLDVYGHVTNQMKKASANRMEQFIQQVSAADVQ